MDLPKLLYTNLYGKKDKTDKPQELQIDGDCIITNYDNDSSKPKGYIQVKCEKNSIFVEEGASSDTTPNVADFSEKKAAVLKEIASLDNSDNILSKNDLEQLEDQSVLNRLKSKINVDIKYSNYVLTVTWGKNDILKIDFSKETNEEPYFPEEPVNGVDGKPVFSEESVNNVDDEPVFPEEPVNGVDHIVKNGDTLSGIAKKYGLTLDELLKINPGLTRKTKLQPDMVINIEPSRTATTQTPKSTGENTNIYVVKKGDTLYKIARKTGISVEDIVAANPGLKPDAIRVGQKIKLSANSVDDNVNNTITPNRGNGAEIKCQHTVKSGESIAKLAQMYKVNTRDILAVNPNLKVTEKNGEKHVNLQPGDVVNIPYPKERIILGFEDISRSEQDFLNALAYRESTNNPGETSCRNGNGYLGLYQIGEEALESLGIYSGDKTPDTNDWRGKWKKNDYGITSKSDFLNSPDKQHKVIISNMRFNWEAMSLDITEPSLKSYIGKTIAGVQITESGLLAGAHLVGVGNVKKFLESNGKIIPQDDNGTTIIDYMKMFKGYDVSNFTDISKFYRYVDS